MGLNIFGVLFKGVGVFFCCLLCFRTKRGLIRKVKILKKPKFDITKLMELHGDGGDDVGMEMMRPEAEEAMNTLTADVTAAADEE